MWIKRITAFTIVYSAAVTSRPAQAEPNLSSPFRASAATQAKSSDDVVLDNRSTPTTSPGYDGGDSPFATTDPDPVQARRSRFRPGVGLSARFGFGLPGGDVQVDAPLSDGLDSVVSIGLSLGYRLNANLFVGVVFEPGYAINSDCPDDVTCSGWRIRSGPEITYNFAPFAKTRPWVGVGAGYEYLTLIRSRGDASVSASFHGVSLVDAMVGMDFLTARSFAGPFVGFSVGQYLHRDVSVSSFGGSGAVEARALHTWLTLGISGTLE
ncbi:MAG: hypothetical protein R3B13_37855 [Polyangiaceae bacterium]